MSKFSKSELNVEKSKRCCLYD